MPVGLRRVPQQARSRAKVEACIRALVLLVGRKVPSQITTADVAEEAGLPLGSLYEYFEDLSGVVDAAVWRMLERHDQLLEDIMVAMPDRLNAEHGLIDALYDTYLQLYREEPGFLALRHSTLFEQHHRRWTTERVERLVKRVLTAALEAGVVTQRADLLSRVDLVLGVGEGILQAVFLRDADGDPVLISEGREILRFAADRIG